MRLTNGRHIAHAVDQGDNGFTDAVAQHVFADHVCICQREKKRGLQRFDIHVQHGEDFHHLHAAPQEKIGIGMPLRGAQTIGPGFG